MNTQEMYRVCNLFSEIIKVNPLKPITDLVEMYARDGVLHIGATDGIMRVVATLPCDCELPNVVVTLSKLTKLLRLTHVPEVVLTDKESYLQFRGEGVYKIPKIFEEDGTKIALRLRMPEQAEDATVFSVEELRHAIKRNNVTLYVGDSTPILARYYNYKNNIITTNAMSLGISYGKLPLTEMYPVLVEQLAALPSDFTFGVVNGGYRISCENLELFTLIGSPNDFPFASLKNLLDFDSICPNTIQINKSELSDALKRVELFKSLIEPIPSVYLQISGQKLSFVSDKVHESLSFEGDIDEKVEIEIKFNLSVLMSLIRKTEPDGALTFGIGEKVIYLKDELGVYMLAGMDK